MIRVLLLVSAVAGFPWASAGDGQHPFGGWYSPERDPAADLETAAAVARETGRLVLMVVGGDWCSWCHALDRFIKTHPDVRKALDGRFVTLKVNVSEENPNREFLARFPEPNGYPHCFVLDGGKRLLGSQDTSKLERKNAYDRDKLVAFAERWGRGRRDTGAPTDLKSAIYLFSRFD